MTVHLWTRHATVGLRKGRKARKRWLSAVRCVQHRSLHKTLIPDASVRPISWENAWLGTKKRDRHQFRTRLGETASWCSRGQSCKMTNRRNGEGIVLCFSFSRGCQAISKNEIPFPSMMLCWTLIKISRLSFTEFPPLCLLNCDFLILKIGKFQLSQ